MSTGIFGILHSMYEKYISILSVGAFVFNDNHQLLIVKKSENEQIDAGVWTIPGGKIYPEEHILVGLKREVLEEVGLEITSPVWIGEDVFQNEGAHFHAEHFRCELKNGEVKLENKLTEYKWISGLNEIASLPFAENIKKRIVLLFTKAI